MKRILSAVLCLVLLLSVCPVSHAALDIAPLQNPDLFSISVEKDSGCAFVTTQLDISERSFTHKYESDFIYSSTQFDILILDYFEDSYPIFRLWLNYAADDFDYITGATFTLDGKRYSFSGISSNDRLYEVDDGVIENMLIIFGTSNIDFISALFTYSRDYFDGSTADNLEAVSIPLTLHGVEDIETTLGGGFLLDFVVMLNAMYSIDGLSYLGRAVASNMKISDAKSATGAAATGIPTDFIILSSEIYAAGDKLNGPGIDTDKVKLTLGDRTVRDGISVDLDYFGTMCHGRVDNGRILWDQEPTVVADAEEMYTEISNQGDFVVIDFNFRIGSVWMVNEHIYKAK